MPVPRAPHQHRYSSACGTDAIVLDSSSYSHVDLANIVEREAVLVRRPFTADEEQFRRWFAVIRWGAALRPRASLSVDHPVIVFVRVCVRVRVCVCARVCAVCARLCMCDSGGGATHRHWSVSFAVGTKGFYSEFEEGGGERLEDPHPGFTYGIPPSFRNHREAAMAFTELVEIDVRTKLVRSGQGH